MLKYIFVVIGIVCRLLVLFLFICAFLIFFRRLEEQISNAKGLIIVLLWYSIFDNSYLVFLLPSSDHGAELDYVADISLLRDFAIARREVHI